MTSRSRPDIRTRLFVNSGADVITPEDPLGLRAVLRSGDPAVRALTEALEGLLYEFTTELLVRKSASTREIAAGLRQAIQRGQPSALRDVLQHARMLAAARVPRHPLLRRLTELADSGPADSTPADDLIAAILEEAVIRPHLATGFGHADQRYPLLFFEHGLVFRPTGRLFDRAPS
jgi:hypothetical protein